MTRETDTLSALYLAYIKTDAGRHNPSMDAFIAWGRTQTDAFGEIEPLLRELEQSIANFLDAEETHV